MTPAFAVDASVRQAHYAQMRARTRELFDLLTDEAYWAQPIDVRHPVVFYDGHLPAFSFNTLVRKALGGPSIDPTLEKLFARGIDPDEREAPMGGRSTKHLWPSRQEVQQFTAEADRRVLEALGRDDLDRPGDPYLDRAEAVHAIFEHEAMHQETLLYLWHRLPYALKRQPPHYVPRTDGVVPAVEFIAVPAGRAALGVNAADVTFSWDNERPALVEEVPAFSMARDNVTNVEFLAFVDAGGYRDERWWRPEDWAWVQREQRTHPPFWDRTDDRWFWHGLFARLPLPDSWPVWVTQAEALAFARWAGRRLPTEGEYMRAAYATPSDDRRERRYPWGEAEPTAAHGVFDFVSWDPQPVGTHPAGNSAWGIRDLVGNGWEWTATPFAPFPGFSPIASYPEYSADFFDGQHFVIKGASPVTARELVRPSFRNWFRPRYPHVYASFRCVISNE